jgi:hypothetical protein
LISPLSLSFVTCNREVIDLSFNKLCGFVGLTLFHHLFIEEALDRRVMYLTGTAGANVFRASWNLDLVSNCSMLVTVIVKPLP